MKLTEAEIITLNNAIVEAARIPATKLHVVEYVEAGMQEASTPTYIPTRDVMQSILDCRLLNVQKLQKKEKVI